MSKDKKSKAEIKETKKAADIVDADMETDDVMEDDEQVDVVDSKEEKNTKTAKDKSKDVDNELESGEASETYIDDNEMDIVIPAEKKKYRLTKRYYLISFVVMVLAALVFVLFGPAATVENIGGKIYTATLQNHFAENRIDELEAEIYDITGFDVDVKLDTSMLTGMQVLEIRVKSGQRISQYLVHERLSEKFPYIELGRFTVSEYSPMQNVDNLITYSVILGLVLVALYLISGILLGGKNGLRVAFAALHDVLLVIALYILIRVPNPRLLIVAALVVLVASPYLNIMKIASLEKNKDSAKKRKAVDAVTDILAYEKGRNINLIVSAGILAAASVVVGIIMSAGTIMWFGGAFAVAFGVAMYSTTAFVPNMWGIAKQPKIKKAKPQKNKKASNSKKSGTKDNKGNTNTKNAAAKGKNNAKKERKDKK